jgi:hypothetical protein
MKESKSNVQVYLCSKHAATAHEIAALRVAARVERAAEFLRFLENDDIAARDVALVDQISRGCERRDAAPN